MSSPRQTPNKPSAAPMKPGSGLSKAESSSNLANSKDMPRPGSATIWFDETTVQSVDGKSVQEYKVATYNSRGATVFMTYSQVLSLCGAQSSEFSISFSRLIRSVKHADFFLECAPVSSATLSKAFSFVLIDAKGDLDRRPASPRHFAPRLARQFSMVVSFANPGGDASMIVPTQYQGTPKSAYGHIGAFIRDGELQQQLELWKALSVAVSEKLAQNPNKTVWISTDGRGAPWICVRVDSRPKYIKHPAYRKLAV